MSWLQDIALRGAVFKFRVEGLGSEALGLRPRVYGLGLRVYRVQDLVEWSYPEMRMSPVSPYTPVTPDNQ